jgi:hypothetical protein
MSEPSREMRPLPQEIDGQIRLSEELEALRGHPAFDAFLGTIDELRALNFDAILNSADPNAMLVAVGEGRALLRVRKLLDSKIKEGREFASGLDESHASFRARQKAMHESMLTAAKAGGPRRYLDSP